MKNIIAYYNAKTNEPICYLKSSLFKITWTIQFPLTCNVKESHEFVDFEIALTKFAAMMLKDIYNGDDHGNITEHELFHMKEDYFGNISIYDVRIIIRSKNEEIQNLRKLKIKKINI